MSAQINLKSEKPFPLPIRAWNFVGKRLPTSKIKVDRLLMKARRNTGLDDFGEDFFMEPLERLVDSINNEANLHSFGKYITNLRLINILSNRLRAEEYVRQNPEVKDLELHPIWWILGLQRTGTTFLQRLLSNTKNTATVITWESINPMPLENDKHNEKRIAAARKSEKTLKVIAPEYFAIHPVEHLMPEEEVLLLDTSFMSTIAEATMHVPSFSDWLSKQDQTPAYQYLEKLLRILQHQKKDAKRWVLKSPHHMEFPDTLYEVFPNTKFIFTHRDPIKTIPSFCSMIYFTRRLFSSEVDTEVIGEHWYKKIRLMLKRIDSFRENNPDCIHIDIAYKELLQDPIGKVQDIYTSFGEVYDEINNEFLNQALMENKKDRYGAHKYELEVFGLDEAKLEEGISGYKGKYSTYI